MGRPCGLALYFISNPLRRAAESVSVCACDEKGLFHISVWDRIHRLPQGMFVKKWHTEYNFGRFTYFFLHGIIIWKYIK